MTDIDGSFLVLIQKVFKFLKMHWDGHSPLLVGYSGGPDSKALLYALLEAGCNTLHIAHVDHGWRMESAREAFSLEIEAKRLSLPFHMIRLTAPVKGNKEAIAREERFSFFESLFKKFSFQALLLAHHAEDQAETVLKRLLEGAHLSRLGGMELLSQKNAITLWRPFLQLRRVEIFSFLKSKQLIPLLDPSNEDSAYLRVRMRKEIFPSLEQTFGKKICSNLLLLSERTHELNAYLDKKIQHHPVYHGPWGMYSFLADLERLEARHFVQKWARRKEVHLPRTLLEPMLDAVFLKRTNYQVRPRCIVDRGFVFFLSDSQTAWGDSALRNLLR